jgi:hypothetical protein
MHEADPNSFPLSVQSFRVRRDLYTHGLTKVHNNDRVAWGFSPIKAYWFGRNVTTNQRYICALLINEQYEPRFGQVFCSSLDHPELTVKPIPCFISSGAKTGGIRYCGTWTFTRNCEVYKEFTYVTGSRPRDCIYNMSLTSYDNNWGDAQ